MADSPGRSNMDSPDASVLSGKKSSKSYTHFLYVLNNEKKTLKLTATKPPKTSVIVTKLNDYTF